ncbi:hypothetical protein H6F43_03115 [Leptolyngbya sp. FACHB-36]|uniref:hypothetical protein n=1 Tax=Leptolyngbya sp. FACHB-36 TaxID=2692808 RepID=UPI0016816A0E|nr:hypothetical protein [Leptolyngbya sp. FACHB-36]MBD2019174.1 hypothetical protein [Leptolyngbya sp. FACHB-36]
MSIVDRLFPIPEVDAEFWAAQGYRYHGKQHGRSIAAVLLQKKVEGLEDCYLNLYRYSEAIGSPKVWELEIHASLEVCATTLTLYSLDEAELLEKLDRLEQLAINAYQFLKSQ